MQDDKRIKSHQPEEPLAELSAEQIEVRALGDVAMQRRAVISADDRDQEQAIEYTEKRQLAIDEVQNADPEDH